MSSFRTLLVPVILLCLLVGAVAGSAYAQDPSGTIAVSGRITYVADDGSIQPAAGVHVLIRDWDFLPAEGPRETLAEVFTDEEGFFSATGISNQDFDNTPRRPDRTGQDVLIEVRTQSPEIVLYNTATLQPFVWSSFGRSGGFFRDVPDGEHVTLNLRIRADDSQAPGMEVYQTMRAGWDFLPTKPTLTNPIVAQWGANSLIGSYYLPGDRIYYDASAVVFPHLILHHFAHALAWEMGGENGYSTQCFPAPDDHTYDLLTRGSAHCAWEEGWAVGFATLVLGDPAYRTADGVIDMEIPDADTPGWEDGDRVAGRVAGSLWDLFDATDDGFDTHTPAGTTPSERFAPIWRAYMAGPHNDTAAFWEAYLAANDDACTAVKAFFQNTIDYNEAPSISELPDITIDEDSTAENVIDLWLFSRDKECPTEELKFELVGDIPPEFGVTLVDNRYISVNPAPNWFGTIEIGVEVSDGLETSRAFFTLTVRGINDDPKLGEIPRFEALINTPIVVDLEPYIEDIDNLKTELTAVVTFLDHATVEINGLVLTFTPETDFEGTETARVQVVDNAGGQSRIAELVLIWSRSPNHRPEIVDLPPIFQQSAGVSIEIDFTQFGRDLEDRPEDLRWDVVELDEHASVLRRTNTVLLFSPEPAGYLGSSFVKVVVSDKDGGRSEPAQIQLLWTIPSNQPPILLKTLREQKAFIGRPLTLDLEGAATDPDGHDAALIWFPNKATVDCCQVSLAAKQKLIFFPLPGWGTQSDEVELIVQDPLGGETRTTVLLTWELFKVYLPFLPHQYAGR